MWNVGKPMVAWRYSARPHIVGAWVTNPFTAISPSPAPGQLVEEQASADDSVAMVDPLAGLAAMQVSCKVQSLLLLLLLLVLPD